MKSLTKFLFAALVAALGVSSCQKAEQYSEPQGKCETVTISLVSPDDAVTKTIGDGTKVKDVYYTAFVDGRPVHSLENKVQLVDGKAVLNLRLVSNVKYNLVFWAQAVPQEGEVSPFDISSFYNDATVKVDYKGLSNDDTRDAFCSKKDILVQGPVNETVSLRRPFAQVNFGSSDYEMVKYLGLHTAMKSEAHIYGLPDVLNVLDGSVSVSGASVPVDAFFTMSAIPSGDDEYITVKGVDYGYVNMNYVLASEVGETVSVKAKMESGQSTWETDLIPNVPVRRNYKTNIVGDLFSEHAVLQIIVVPDFKTPDEIEKI
jgi:hypothetical protein